jgi:hypothetical protein
MGEKVEEEDDEEGGDELAKGELRYSIYEITFAIFSAGK